ncbi:MAG: 3-oxoacyl-[acyl-carrier-protein] reductase FabG [Syntrophus sp. SKADARSKE-3]|nr:3-oxoacyl-[acyl-carrier-protein] reductase FabG [Syntrophus sp. SKADARSKE-3]
MELNFVGRRALILGGTCDLAITLAKIMIESSIIPILTCRDEEGRNSIRQSLGQCGDKFETAFIRLGDNKSLERLFFGEAADIDFLVDFAQGDYECFVAAADEDEVHRYFVENVAFRAEVLKKAARVMLNKKSGRMVFVSSAAAVRTNPGQGFYAAAKLASEQLYKNIGIELGRRGVTSVTLRPGYIDAGRGGRFLRERGDELLKRIPVGRPLSSSEVAGTIMFLLSETAKGINATEIIMDGGLTQSK